MEDFVYPFQFVIFDKLYHLYVIIFHLKYVVKLSTK